MHSFQEIHRRALVIDGHSDIPIDVIKRRLAGEQAVLYNHHLPAWRAGGVDAAILTVTGDEMEVGDTSMMAYALSAIQHMKADVQDRPNDLALVTTAGDLLRESAAGRFPIVLNVEGSRPLGGDLDNLHQLYDAGIRFLTLTWNYKNEVGVGAAFAEEDTGLTAFGRQVIQTMADLGMVSDLSHASPITFWEAIAMDTGTLVATHSNAAALKPHVRNISDDQIRAIAAQDGYVGVCFYPGFLHDDDPGVEHVVDHIIHIAEVAGIDHVALGPDYIDYALEEIVAHIQNSSVDYGDNFIYPREVKTIRSFYNLTQELARRGFDEDSMIKVLGGNILRVFERATAGALP